MDWTVSPSVDHGMTNDWVTYLPMAEFAHNSWRHDVMCKSPHKLLMGFSPQVHVKFQQENVPSTHNQLKSLEESRTVAQKLLEKIQTTWDQHKATEMKVGQCVWLEGKNLQVAGHRKLLPKRYGPFPIMEWIRPVAYQLKLPEQMKIHDVFHIDLLMPYKETEAYRPSFTHPPPVIKEGEEEYEVETIRDIQRKGRGWKLQYLIHWKGYPSADDSWVDHEDMHTPEVLKQFYLDNPTVAGWPHV